RVPADERTDRDTHASGFRAVPFAAARLSFVPLEELGSTIDRLLHERAGDVAALAVLVCASEWRLARRRVDTMESDGIDLEPMRRPGEQRLHDGVHLCAARRPLRCRRRRVGQYGKAAE